MKYYTHRVYATINSIYTSTYIMRFVLHPCNIVSVENTYLFMFPFYLLSEYLERGGGESTLSNNLDYINSERSICFSNVFAM